MHRSRLGNALIGVRVVGNSDEDAGHWPTRGERCDEAALHTLALADTDDGHTLGNARGRPAADEQRERRTTRVGAVAEAHARIRLGRHGKVLETLANESSVTIHAHDPEVDRTEHLGRPRDGVRDFGVQRAGR